MQEPMLRWFEYSHLPQNLAKTSRPYRIMAFWLTKNLPRGAERTVALRKLLESKDCAVRAQIGRIRGEG